MQALGLKSRVAEGMALSNERALMHWGTFVVSIQNSLREIPPSSDALQTDHIPL